MMHVSPGIRKKIEPLIQNDDESFQRQGYDLATTLQPDMTVFPKDGAPYTRKPYEGDDYLEDATTQKKMSDIELKYYLSDIDLLPAVKQAQQNFGDAWDNISAAGISDDDVSLDGPDAMNKAKLLDALNQATHDAIFIAGKIADEKNEEMEDVYRKIFGPFIPPD